MPKVALIGAGSVVFANNLVGDLLTYPQLKDELEFSLMDIDPDRLEVAHGYIRRRVDAAGAGARVEATLNLEESLRGADYVVNMIQVGGLESTLIDFDIPEKLTVCSRPLPTPTASEGSSGPCAPSPRCWRSAAGWRSSAPSRC